MHRPAAPLLDDIDAILEEAGLLENDAEFRPVIASSFGPESLARCDRWGGRPGRASDIS